MTGNFHERFRCHVPLVVREEMIDGKHNPRDIEKVLAPLLNGADVVMSMTV